MSLLKRNVLANFIGTGWTALMSIIFIPLYINFLGIEVYGLLGVYGALQAAISLLDLGLSQTLNRELARLSAEPGRVQDMRNMVRTLEVVYWLIALIIAAVLIPLAPIIARYWLQAGQLPLSSVTQAILLIALIIALQWPISFYSGGLKGLERQVILNVINGFVATLRGVGAVLVLWLISPTVQAFFAWQIITSILHTFLVVLFLWLRLPATGVPVRFQTQILRQIWRFAAGMSGISVVVLILSQLDKVILSKLLTLEMFGYYTLAGALAANLGRLSGPLFTSVFPRLTRLVAHHDLVNLTRLYHRSCQFMSILILPLAIILALFAHEILSLWLKDPIVVANTYLLFSLLTVATTLNGLVILPYALQLAYGWTKLALYYNLIAVVVLTPLIIWGATYYGAVGAALIWLGLNASYVLLTVPIMHTRLLKREKKAWYYQDVGLPLIGALSVALLARWWIPENLPTWLTLVLLVITFSLALLCSILAAPDIRRWLVSAFVPKLSDLKQGIF